MSRPLPRGAQSGGRRRARAAPPSPSPRHPPLPPFVVPRGGASTPHHGRPSTRQLWRQWQSRWRHCRRCRHCRGRRRRGRRRHGSGGGGWCHPPGKPASVGAAAHPHRRARGCGGAGRGGRRQRGATPHNGRGWRRPPRPSPVLPRPPPATAGPPPPIVSPPSPPPDGSSSADDAVIDDLDRCLLRDAELLSLVRPDAAGFLWRKSPLSGWRRYWHSLARSSLYYFEKRDAPGARRGPVVGCIPLFRARAALAGAPRRCLRLEFDLTDGAGRVHVLRAESQAELHGWLRAVALARNTLPPARPIYAAGGGGGRPRGVGVPPSPPPHRRPRRRRPLRPHPPLAGWASPRVRPALVGGVAARHRRRFRAKAVGSSPHPSLRRRQRRPLGTPPPSRLTRPPRPSPYRPLTRTCPSARSSASSTGWARRRGRCRATWRRCRRRWLR